MLYLTLTSLKESRDRITRGKKMTQTISRKLKFCYKPCIKDAMDAISSIEDFSLFSKFGAEMRKHIVDQHLIVV